MLRTTLICAAILIGTMKAEAQTTVPFPGYGPLYSNGTINGGRDYSDWQSTRRDHGLDYDQSAIEPRHDYYQPAPSVDPYHGHGYNGIDDDAYGRSRSSIDRGW